MYVLDGIWKLRFPHCFFKVPMTVAGLSGLNYPSVCTNSPCYKKGTLQAFCEIHCNVAEQQGVSSGLRDFLQYCGVQGIMISLIGMDLHALQ